MSVDAVEVLRSARRVLVIDWPARDVPDSLALAGVQVVAHEGPGEEDYVRYEVQEGAVVTRPPGAAPAAVDLVYTFRPVEELPDILAMAQSVGERAVWAQFVAPSDEVARSDRSLVESAGLTYIDAPSIVEAARSL